MVYAPYLYGTSWTSTRLLTGTGPLQHELEVHIHVARTQSIR